MEGENHVKKEKYIIVKDFVQNLQPSKVLQALKDTPEAQNNANLAEELAFLQLFLSRPESASPEELSSAKYRQEALKAYALFCLLVTKTMIRSVQEIRETAFKALNSLEPNKISEVTEAIQKKESENITPLKEVDDTANEDIRNIINQAREDLKNEPAAPVVRFMSKLFTDVEQYCSKNSYKNPLQNLTIGDVESTTFPPLLREKMGLNPLGPKGLQIAIDTLLYKTKYAETLYRYDIAALGIPELREKFVDYAKYFGLYENESPKETIIGAGGAPTLSKSLVACRKYLEEKFGKGEKFSIIFPNPNLRMLAEVSRNAGFNTIESSAKSDNDFFLGADEIDKILTDNPNCKVFLNTPIGNPNGTVESAESMKKVIKVLEKHDVILIDDLAYLGLGDFEKSKEVCSVLNNYEKRIDIIPMTKIFAKPGLRCASAISPSSELSAYFKSICQNMQPTESYAVQAEALAMWKNILIKDIKELALYFKKRQSNLIAKLAKIDQERINQGKTPLFNPNKKIMGDAALYVYCPLNEGVDPFDVIEATLLVGTPGVGFDAGEEGKKYIRFSVGIEDIQE